MTPASLWPSSAPRWPWPGSPPTARPSRSGSGSPVLRDPGQGPAGRLRRLRARRRLRRLVAATRAVYDEAKDEWVLNGTKTWITNGGIADIHVVVAFGRPRRSGPAARPASSCPRDTPGISAGPEVQEDGHPGLAHRRGRAGRLPGPGRAASSVARRSSTSGWPGPSEGKRSTYPGGHGDLRGLPPHRRRPGPRHRPGRLRVLARLRQGAQGSSAGPSSRTRPSPSSWPT